MLADRPTFALLAGALFAAFDKQASDLRMDAYWRGLSAMSIGNFERTVNHVIGPEGEDELPTPKQLYAINRRLASAQRAAELAGRKVPPPQGEEVTKPDVYDDYTGRVLLAVLCKLINQHGCAATDESLAEMVHVKHRFAKGYREMCIQHPEASLDLRDALIAALTPRFVPRDPPREAPSAGDLGAAAMAAVAL